VHPSPWSDLDASARPSRFVTGLDRLRADPFFATQKARLLAEMELRGGERVVDVGCGTGEDTVALAREGCDVVGLERSSTMLGEARRRHPGLGFVAGDAHRLPFRDATLDRVRADRVVQHLARSVDALRDWKRALRPGGAVVVFEPDLATARIEGVDRGAAEAVVEWRASTRPGGPAVHALGDVLRRAGFGEVHVDEVLFELGDLRRADGIMGLEAWGEAAGAAGRLAPEAAARWRDDARTAWGDGRLRYSCSYVIGRARTG
jgi:SAM-dependent methyltransferase